MATPGPSGCSPRRRRGDVQPDESDGAEAHDWSLRAELDKLDNLTEAQKLERLVERDIVLQLQLQDFEPACEDWRELAGALIEYGYSVLMGWTVTGTIRAVASRANGGQGVYGIERIPEGLQLPHDRAHELVMDLLEVAVEKFRTHTVAKNRWSPTGGASLRTFFIGRSLMSLPDTYEQWNRREMNTYGLRPGDRPDTTNHGRNPAATVVTSTTIDDVFNGDGRATTSTEVRVMFELQQLDWTLAEIATALTDVGYPNTEATVRTKMSRARADARHRLADDVQP